MGQIIQNTAVIKLYFLGAALTTVSCNGISKGGGAFAAAHDGTVTSLGSGWYKISLDAIDTNSVGDLAIDFTAVAGAPVDPPAEQVIAPSPLYPVFANSDITGSASTTVTLASNYNGIIAAGQQIMTLNGNTFQLRNIISIAFGGTTVITVDRAWDGNPSNSTWYYIFPGNTPRVDSGLNVSTTGGSAPTTAQIVTAIMQDTTAGNYTTAGSFGKGLFTSGNAPGAAGGLALVGSNVGSATSVSGSVGSVVGINAALIDASISSRSTYSGGAVASVTGSVGSVAGVTFPANFSSLVISSSGMVKIQSGITKNVAVANFEFVMRLSSDHVTPATLKTVTATRSIDGGAFGACTNAVVEVGSGIYAINLSAADLNGATITLAFVATGCDTTFVTILTTP